VFPYKDLFCILAMHKLEQEQKIDKAEGGGASEGMLAPKPLSFEKPIHSRMGFLIGAAWSS